MKNSCGFSHGYPYIRNTCDNEKYIYCHKYYTSVIIETQYLSLHRQQPRAHALRESCSTPHHPMRVNLPTVICTTTGMSKITFQKPLPKTPFIILLPLRKNKTARKLSLRRIRLVINPHRTQINTRPRKLLLRATLCILLLICRIQVHHTGMTTGSGFHVTYGRTKRRARPNSLKCITSATLKSAGKSCHPL